MLKLITFDEAFKLNADDIARGEKYINQRARKYREYPEFGKIMLFMHITNLDTFLDAQVTSFLERYNQNTAAKYIENAGFEHIRTLFSGDYGHVTMVRSKDDNIYYARKSFSKHYLVMTKKIQRAKDGKQILHAVRFPFTVNLKYCYIDNTYVNLILPLLAGGDLFRFLEEQGRFGERLAKFITSQVLLALEYLHRAGLIHRNISLENILIDHYGYIKLTDFTLCKLINYERTYTLCGTIEYMAPEVISQKGYGFATDWWSFGVLIYELCSGVTPFFADETIQIFNLIANCDYAMPVYFSLALKSLIPKLIQPDVTKRIGNLHYGVDDIKQETWFVDVPWLAILNYQIISPLIPFISDEMYSKFFLRDPPPVNGSQNLYAAEFENF